MPIEYRFRIKNPTKVSWFLMKQRCNNPKNTNYHRYGGRGIRICDRWNNSYENFFLDMGERPPEKTIDRKDVNGDYTPKNCRWATRKEQMNNRARTVYIVIEGVKYRLMDLARKSKLKRDTIQKRAMDGMSYDQVMAETYYRDLSGFALGGKASGAIKRNLTHCKRGHEFTPENTYLNKEGGRVCRKCHYLKTKRQAQRKAVARKLLKGVG